MDDPANEIASVVTLLTAAVNPDIQREAVLKYYAPDMQFRHPLCAVYGGPSTRDTMLAILQWYRIMSPVLSVRVTDVTYDKDKNFLFLDITQTFHIRWSPLSPAPARLLVHLTLRPHPSPADPSKTTYLIAEQEDFYHPDDLAALLVPPLVPVIRLALRAAALACRVQSRLFRALGYWAVHDGEGGRDVDVQPVGEPLPPVGDDEHERVGLREPVEGDADTEVDGGKRKKHSKKHD